MSGNNSVYQIISGIEKVFCMRSGYHDFLSFFVSQCRKGSWGTLQRFREFWYRKIFCIGRGYHYFPLKFFLSQSAGKVRRGTPPVFQKNLVSKNFMHRRGASRFCRKVFVSQCLKNSWVKPSIIQKISGDDNFMHRKGISLFSVQFFLSDMPEKFEGEPLRCFKKIWYRKISCIGGGHHGFVGKFLSHSA